MQILISSDNHTMATKLRHILAHNGFECPVGNVVSLEESKTLLRVTDQDPDLLLLVLPDDDQRSLDELKQCRAATSKRLIVVGNGDNAGRILEAVHAGADDFLDENRDITQQLTRALDQIRAKLAESTLKGRLTTVTAASGGCGASTIAANLGVLAARETDECLLLDLDPRGGDLASLLNLNPQHSIADLCRNIDSLDRNIFDQSLVRHSSGVQLLAAPHHIGERETIKPDRVRRIVNLARSSVTELIADVSDPCDATALELLQQSDRIVVAFRLEFPSLKNLRRILDEWYEHDIDIERVDLVANRYGLKHKLPISKIEHILSKKVAHRLVDDSVSMNLSINCGSPVVLESANTPVAKALEQLSKDIGLISTEPESAVHEGNKRRPSVFSRLAGLTRGVLDSRLAKISE